MGWVKKGINTYYTFVSGSWTDEPLNSKSKIHLCKHWNVLKGDVSEEGRLGMPVYHEFPLILTI